MNLNGTLIAVTGGARGIGLATAQALTRRGAIVHIGDLDGTLARAEAHRLGLRAGHELNVADRVSFAAFLDAIRTADGPLEMLVNNAGVMPFGPFLDEDENVTAQTVGVNLIGVVNGMRLALPSMVERGHGHVLNVASLAARVPVPGSAVYSGTKAAVVALTDSVRRELRGTGVNLTTVLPTMVATELTSGVPSGRGLIAIDPEDAAMTIARALQRPGGTIVAGPSWLDLASRLMILAPRPVDRLVRALLKDDRLLAGYDPTARAVYNARLAAARNRPGAAQTVPSLRRFQREIAKVLKAAPALVLNATKMGARHNLNQAVKNIPDEERVPLLLVLVLNLPDRMTRIKRVRNDPIIHVEQNARSESAAKGAHATPHDPARHLVSAVGR